MRRQNKVHADPSRNLLKRFLTWITTYEIALPPINSFDWGNRQEINRLIHSHGKAENS
ncbi:MAG: hypothetical protein ACYTG7_11485 [Planctomycetota bacterium]|jgi:hypothetical protein